MQRNLAEPPVAKSNLHALLRRLEAGPGGRAGVEGRIEFEWISFSKTYTKSYSEDNTDASSTIRSWVSQQTAGTTVDRADLTIGCGVLSAEGHPERMKWTTLSQIGNMTFQDAFGGSNLRHGERHLIVYNLFSSDQYDYDVLNLERQLSALRGMRQWVG